MFTLEELKEWINSLPDEFLKYDVVNSTLIDLDEDFNARLDKPVSGLSVDEDSKEVLIITDVIEESETVAALKAKIEYLEKKIEKLKAGEK